MKFILEVSVLVSIEVNKLDLYLVFIQRDQLLPPFTYAFIFPLI